MTIKNPINQRTGIYARQGDIGLLFYPQDVFDPEDHDEVDAVAGRLDLGIGTATSHRHQVSAADAQLFRQKPGKAVHLQAALNPWDESDLILVVHKDTPMLHPEHGNKTITAGLYIVRRQMDGATYVAD